jgi:hypothetical protein
VVQVEEKTYQYAGLPDPKKAGMDVSACSSRIHRLAYVEERLMFLQAVHIVTAPERDLKGLLSRLQYEDGGHSTQLKTRLTEMRVSKHKAYQTPDDRLRLVFDEAMFSSGSIELLAALVTAFKPALLDAYRRYLADTNALADYPSVMIIRRILAEEEEGLYLLQQAYRDIVDTPEKKAQADGWANSLLELLSMAGGIDGATLTQAGEFQPVRAQQPFHVARKPTQDDAFPHIWDFIHTENSQVSARLAQIVATRLGELTIAQALAIVLWEVKDQPWDFYRDISRHMWDEMRHSLFGEAAAQAILGDRSAMPMRDFEVDYLFKMTPIELYSLLGVGVEAGLMKYPPGKREEYEFCRDIARHPLMTIFQDFDWADEVLHVNIARQRLKEWYRGDQTELMEMAQKGLEFRSRTRNLQPASPLPAIHWDPDSQP